jgi:hypothetical protein
MIRHAGRSIWDGLSGDEPIYWFWEEPEFEFLADPFGIWRDDHLHVFAEHYDYRTRHGTIQKLCFDESLNLIDRRTVLAEPWHLSYPQVVEDGDDLWMLPEAHRSGGLTLYKSCGTLDQWTPACRLELDAIPVDATLLRHEGKWWIFYSPATSKHHKIAHLHVAWADQVTGPWTAHPMNPVRVDVRSSRPGGAPVLMDGNLILPVQDCSQTYGGAIRPLAISRLDEAHFVAEMGEALDLKQDRLGYDEGLHTINQCGDVTLFDVKRIDRSLKGIGIDLKRTVAAKLRR